MDVKYVGLLAEDRPKQHEVMEIGVDYYIRLGLP
jgi:hypothetical protein